MLRQLKPTQECRGILVMSGDVIVDGADGMIVAPRASVKDVAVR